VIPAYVSVPDNVVQTVTENSHTLKFTNRGFKEVARIFDPSVPVPGFPDWECIPTPGHTPGHVAFLRISDRVLIAGDAIATVNLNSIWGFLLWALRQKHNTICILVVVGWYIDCIPSS
jgi:glyoxylase-like metal-dependent hydrolase (beta-lactamase superfamily II)